MKKYAFFVVLALLIAPGVALSQSGSNAPRQSANGEPMHPNRPDGQEGGNSAQFQARKAEILQRISTRINELQQRQNCVQAANNRQALMACMPQDKGQH